MQRGTILDQSLIWMGMAIMVLSVVSSIDSLIPVGVGAAIIGMNGLEATRIRDYIKKLHEED